MTLQAKLYRIFVTLFVVIAASGFVAADGQVVGATLSGTVRDATGAALSGATVTVKQLETGATRTLTTGADGRYAAPSVPVGDYTVTAAHDGFAAQERTGITLVVAQSLVVDFQLGVDAVQTDVVVQAEVTGVNTTSQQTSGLIDERAGEGAAAERAQLRRTADAESGHGELHRRALGRHRDLELVGGQHVQRERTPAAGQSVSAERNRVHRRIADQRDAGRNQRRVTGRGCGARIQRGDRHLRRELRQARRRAGKHRDHLGNQPAARHGI